MSAAPAPPPGAFLAVDVGNSSAKVALWDGAAWSETRRFSRDAMPPRVWGDRLRPFVARGTPWGIASVAPWGVNLAEAVEFVTGRRAVAVSARLALPFDMAYATPETLGADRLAAVVAAWHLGGGRPVVAVDAGTAVTLDAVDVRFGRAVYLGGAIAPGPDLLARSLARGTGALPDIPFGDPADGPVHAVGDSTHEAIRTGVAGMFAGGVAHLLATTATALSAPPFVVATGGGAPWLVAHGLTVDALVPTLVLDGIRLLCDRPLPTAHRPTDAAAPFRRG